MTSIAISYREIVQVAASQEGEKGMDQEFGRLFGEIQRLSGRNGIYYVRNTGNWGDALIHSGFSFFATCFGLSCVELNKKLVRRRGKLFSKYPSLRFLRIGGVLLYGGGGAWCHADRGAEKFVHLVAGLFDHVVVLPSSYELRNVYLPSAQATYFARDVAESRVNNPTSIFCHDMALCLRHRLDPEVYEKRRETGYFFRTDAESAGKFAIPDGNRDLSVEGTHRDDIGPFLHQVGKHRMIHTDRLHVAIAGCLTGAKVLMYPGSYFKNEAVYQASLRPLFPTQIEFWRRSPEG